MTTREPVSPRPPVSALVPLGALVALSIAYRLPPLVNAGTVDSDAAIVGLQARHILRGEWSWFLYGSGYQTSVDSAVAALFFALFGATPLALLVSTLAGHIAATCFAFATLTRRIPRPAAFVVVLPLVFTSCPLHTYILNPPRQAALTLVFVALFVLDGASLRATPRARLAQHAAGAALASVACFADPYALLFLPPLVLFGLMSGYRADLIPLPLLAKGRRGDRENCSPLALLGEGGWGGEVCVLVGAAVGLIPFALLLRSPHSVHGETTLTLGVVRHNAALLLDPCLPWLLGVVAFVPRALLGYVAWDPGSAFHAVQWTGGALFLIAVASGGVALVRSRIPWSVRRLGGFGFVVAIVTVASFLVSVMVMDLFSSRYLAALVLASPFAIAPLAFVIGWRKLFLTLAPFLVAAGVCGWVGYGDQASGLRIVDLPGHGAGDERLLEQMLLQRGVHAAVADYWVSYRLTFLYDEDVVVVPIHEREDRYAPYRQAYRAATRSAYIFDPKRSREELRAMEAEAFAGAGGAATWGRPIERLHAGALTAVIFERSMFGGP